MKIIQAQKVFEKSGTSLMARFRSPDGDVGVQADITSIALSVFEVETKKRIVNATSVTVASVVYDTLQTDSRWTDEAGAAIDTTGYNFRYDSLVAQLPEGNQHYRFEFWFTPASGQPFPIVFDIETIPLFHR